MAKPKLSKKESGLIKMLRGEARKHLAAGMDPSAAMRRALDDEIASTEAAIRDLGDGGSYQLDPESRSP